MTLHAAPSTETPVRGLVDPYLRSALYKALSSLYTYPDEDVLTGWRRQAGEIVAALAAYAQATERDGTPAAELPAAVHALDPLAAQVEFVDLFDYRPPCPLYESAHVKPDQGNPANLYLDIEACYRASGIDVSSGFGDPPDHIALELEFMHYLTHREGLAAEAGDEGRMERFLTAQQQFVTNHIGRWVPAFGKKTTRHAKLPFFKLLGEITTDFITRDADYLSSLFREA